MRSIDCAALLVCSVEKTRWPVSAAVMAVCIVFQSRISPTMMTSGSCRNMFFRASLKLGRVGRDLALGDRGLAVGEEELDRVLDRDDVDRPLLDDRAHDAGERRGLARARRARDRGRGPSGRWTKLSRTSGRFSSVIDGSLNGIRRKTAA